MKRLFSMMTFILFGYLLSDESFAKDVTVSGDWVLVNNDGKCLAQTKSPYLKYTFNLYTWKGVFEGTGQDFIVSWVVGKDLHKIINPIEFVFDKKIKIKGLVTDADNEDNLNLDVMLGPNKIKTQLKKSSEFQLTQNDTLVAGPFSLQGSSKAIQFLTDCGRS
jgi:hypothetical protein